MVGHLDIITISIINTIIINIIIEILKLLPKW